MANEMFTTRSGKQVPVPQFFIPADEVASLMRLQEDYQKRGEHLSLLGVVLDVLDKGKRQVQNQWKNGDLSKNRRNFAKAVAPYMRDPARYANEIATLAGTHNLVNGTQVDLSSPEEDEQIEENLTTLGENLTEKELEVLTAPEKA